MAPNTILIRRMICKSHTNRACSRIIFKEVILWKLWYWWAGRCLSGPSDSGRWASWTAFSRRKTLPAGGSGRGRPAEKEKFCAGTREKRRDRGKTRGGAQTVFLHSLGPSCIRNRSTTAETKKSGLAVLIFCGRWAGPLPAASIRTAPVADRQRCGQLKRPLCGALGVQDLLYEMSATRKPGGCADLLCLSLMLFFLEEKGGREWTKKRLQSTMEYGNINI